MRRLASIALSLVILTGGVAIAAYLFNRAARDGVETAPERFPTPTNVRVKTLEHTTIDDVFVLNGRVAPWEQRNLSAETAGVIEWRGVELGDTVRADQQLFKVDTTTLQTRLAQARARKTLAAQELERIEGMRAGGIASPRELDRARSEHDVAAADLAAAEIQLEKSTVRAPMAGTVDQVQVEEREFVDTGTPLLRLVQLDPVKGLVGLPEREAPLFDVGDVVDVRLDALPGEAFTGTIHRIAPTADEQTRTFMAELRIDNPGGRLKPGMTLRAHLLRARRHDGLAAPVFAVRFVDNQRFVAVEEDGVARIRVVETGIIAGDAVEILSGLAVGERLIVAGHRELRDGDPVRVTAEES